MPNPSFAPRPAIAAAFDARPWAGVALYELGADTVTGPASWGVYDDALALITGRGSVDTTTFAGSLLRRAIAQATGVTYATLQVSILPDDRITVAWVGATPADLLPGADNAIWGYDPAGQTSVTSGPLQVLTAATSWRRGNIPAGASMTWERGASSGPVPSAGVRVHSPLDTVRDVLLADADQVPDSLPILEAATAGFAGRWGVTPDGRAWRSRPAVDSAPLTWLSASFRDALGFTGAETEVVEATDWRTIYATHPLPGLLTTTRPAEHVWRGHRSEGAATQGSDRRAYHVTWLDLPTIDARLWLDGAADAYDREAHWLERVRPLMPPGSRCELYQDWGDYRRALRTIATGATVPPYSPLHTSQDDGRYGRLRCRVRTDAPRSTTIAWPRSIYRRAPLDLALQLREGGQ